MCTEAEKSGELCCKSAGRMVNILSNQLKRRFLVPDDGNELTMLQRHMLHFIIVGSMHQDIFQKDIEQRFAVGRSTVTNLLQLMEKKGFVRRESVKQDARLKKVILTEKGITSQESFEDIVEHIEEELSEGISEEELHIFYKVLDQINQNVKKYEVR